MRTRENKRKPEKTKANRRTPRKTQENQGKPRKTYENQRVSSVTDRLGSKYLAFAGQALRATAGEDFPGYLRFKTPPG